MNLVFQLGHEHTVTLVDPQHLPRVGDIVHVGGGPYTVRFVSWIVRDSHYDVHVKLAPASVAEALGLAEDGKR